MKAVLCVAWCAALWWLWASVVQIKHVNHFCSETCQKLRWESFQLAPLAVYPQDNLKMKERCQKTDFLRSDVIYSGQGMFVLFLGHARVLCVGMGVMEDWALQSHICFYVLLWWTKKATHLEIILSTNEISLSPRVLKGLRLYKMEIILTATNTYC